MHSLASRLVLVIFAVANLAILATISPERLQANELESDAPTPPKATVTGDVSSNDLRPRNTTLKYPETKKTDVQDDYFGTVVPDPYRWLEETDAPDTLAWIESQMELTESYLKTIPKREELRQRLTEIWNYERYGQPTKHGDRYFYQHNNGLQNQSVLYWAESLEAPRKLLLDPNELREDGTVSLADWVPSDDGKLLAYGISGAGSDWKTWYVRDVESGKDLDEVVEWVKFSSVAWTKDGKGFFYSRYDQPKEGEEKLASNYYQKLYYHRIGTPQAEDQLIYKRDDEKEWGFSAAVTDDGAYLIISVWRGTEDRNLVFYAKLNDNWNQAESSSIQVKELISEFVWDYSFIGNDGDRFYFLTDDHAPKRRVIAIDLAKPTLDQWTEVIPESEHTLQTASLLSNRFFTTYLQDATSAVEIYAKDGKKLGAVELPGLGTVAGFEGKQDAKETFYSFLNYITPPTIYRLDLETDTAEVWRRPEIDFRSEDYVTERVFYESKDGTRVPMILSYRKGLERDGSNPTMLYAYGGFNISLTPRFSPANLVWMEMGGIYAVPNLRGGGEYGREWHEAGMLDQKQNVFDDFIAAAEYLIDNRYTSSNRLAIHGGSNGGLLVGAVMAQRPELYAVAVPSVGVMDMLRFQKFTIGWAWVNEYGSSDDPEQFKTLLAYSPLHNLKPGTSYPATLVMTADHDDRVVPGHSFKFAATLQAAQTGSNPTLIRIEKRAGHGAGTPVTKLIETAADLWAFVYHNLGMK